MQLHLILNINGNIEQIYHVCEKYQSKDEKFPEPKGEGNLVSRLVFFANTPPNMIYLFNYVEYYLEHWLNK
jgi:hypothetical protein